MPAGLLCRAMKRPLHVFVLSLALAGATVPLFAAASACDMNDEDPICGMACPGEAIAYVGGAAGFWAVVTINAWCSDAPNGTCSGRGDCSGMGYAPQSTSGSCDGSVSSGGFTGSCNVVQCSGNPPDCSGLLGPLHTNGGPSAGGGSDAADGHDSAWFSVNDRGEGSGAICSGSSCREVVPICIIGAGLACGVGALTKIDLQLRYPDVLGPYS